MTKRTYGIMSLIAAVTLLFIAGCGSKEEVKKEVQNSATKQQVETSKIQTEAEMSKNMPNTEGVGVEQEASKGEDIDYIGIHSITLDKIYSWTKEGTEGVVIADGEQVIIDTIKKLGKDNAIYDMGYAIEEVNDDGIPDLIIGQPHQEGIGNMIYAIYTWKDGNFRCNAEGAEYVHVSPGKINEAQVIYCTPFAYYEPGMKLEADTENPSMEEPVVAVQWLEDVYLEPNGYDVFTADSLAEQRQVVFIGVSTVYDFKVLSLNFESVDDNGKVKYDTEVLYGQTELIPERPLMVGMSCDSTISCYGISYVDGNGVTRNFAIEVSGMDGAVLLSEF